MDTSLFDGYLLSLAVMAVAGLAAWSMLHVLHDAQEPPLVKSRIPVIGHLVGLMYYRTAYYLRLSHSNPGLPAFTLKLGPSKIYVIASPQLIQVAMRQKTLSFDPLTISFAERMVGFGPNIMGLMHNPPTDGSEPWLHAQHKCYEVLAPGPALYEMNEHVLTSIAGVLNAIGEEFETKKLYMWLRNSFTLATNKALFGSQNPMVENPELNEYLWDYETGQVNLLLQPFPSWTAQKPYKSRAKLQQALRAYFHAENDQKADVSRIVKRRVAVNKKWGLPIDDIADHELGMMFVSVTNAIPTLFWLICYVFRDPNLVEELRNELLTNLKIDETMGTGAPGKCVLNIGTFSTACPLLLAVYQETMRLTNRQMGTRTVLEDTLLKYTPTGESAGEPISYLLKKGAQIQTPAMISNFQQETWGEDVFGFNPKRFDTTKEQERLQKKALNPFGGGKHLCPGRHFAYAEILGAVATLVLGFEMESPEGGRIQVPAMNNNIAEAVCKPIQDVQQNMLTRIRRRPGWETVEWSFESGSRSEEDA